LAIPAIDSDYSKQFDSQLSLPAANARPNRSIWSSSISSRSLALDHS
jgi:hypothetical protein